MRKNYHIVSYCIASYQVQVHLIGLKFHILKAQTREVLQLIEIFQFDINDKEKTRIYSFTCLIVERKYYFSAKFHYHMKTRNLSISILKA